MKQDKKKKEKFVFANQENEEDNIIFEEEHEEVKEEKTEEELLEEKLIKRKIIKKYTFIILAHIIGSFLLVLFALYWQDRFDVMAYSNAFLFAFVMVFFTGWIMLIYNQNIISLVTHSFKTFGLMIVGKRPKKAYYEVKEDVEDNQVPKIYMIITFTCSIILLIPTIILTILAY